VNKQYEMTVKLSRSGVIEIGYWIEQALITNASEFDKEIEAELRAFVNSIDEQLENAERMAD